MKRRYGSYAVLGLSRFGFHAAVGLARAGAPVIAVDRDEGTIQRIASTVGKAVQADVLDFDALESLGVTGADVVVIGLRRSFEAAVLLTSHLRKRTRVKRIITQADSDEKAEALRLVGADRVVVPSRFAAGRLVRKLTTPNLVDEIPLAADAAIVEVNAPSDFTGKSLAELKLRARHRIHVVGVVRKSATGGRGEMILAPPADTRFEKGDLMLLLGRIGDLERFTG